MKFKNLIIVGTSHIAKQSMREVEEAVSNNKPDIIAIELDRRRFIALMHKKKGKKDRIRLRDIRRIGVKGYLFSLIGGYIQKKLGKIVGVVPGSDMKKAIKLAKKNNLQIALIDQDIEVTLKKFSKSFTWREKWHIVADIFKGIFFRKNVVQFDLSKVPDEQVIKKMMKEVKVRYPNLYRVLVTERNKIMAVNLFKIMKEHPDKKILAVVGAGHAEDMMKIIEGKHRLY
ncbi:MAG: TraB/GumN family protein [Candidatus Woesearchaeota archaeon]|jgi:pheromone shutdown-related protein TraB|nr:TraB/GumN family protein [Candidatus Woesearchaeota archaeon]